MDDKWSGIITPIQDQEWCGASWALSATSVASDRLAIMSKGKEVAKYSAQHLMSCGRAQQGCNGGHIDRAWSFLNKHGYVKLESYYRHVSSCERGNSVFLPKAFTICLTVPEL